MMAETVRSTLKKKSPSNPYSGQLRGAETAPSDICTQEERGWGVDDGLHGDSITHTHIRTRTHAHTAACAIATKDTLNDLSRVVLCNLGDVRGEKVKQFGVLFT